MFRQNIGEEKMDDSKRTPFVNVRDRAGNEYICPLEALKDLKHATEEELKNCVDDARSPHPYAGG